MNRSDDQFHLTRTHQPETRRFRGQGLVEFALILPALLMILFSIIEGAFLFQAYLAVQHAARDAARFAAMYQPPQTYSLEQGQQLLRGLDPGTPAYPAETREQWYQRRVNLIRQHAFDQSMGIRILHTALGNYQKPVVDSGWANMRRAGFFGVRVRGYGSQQAVTNNIPEYDHPSLPGLPVQVEVLYCWAPFDPIIGAIVSASTPGGNCVLLSGSATMVNEGVQVGMGAVQPPTFPTPPPPPGATPTPTGNWTPGPTATPTQYFTPTPTPTPVPPTPTPNYPYILLIPRQERWLWEEWDTRPGTTPQINIELYNHPAGPTYQFFWNDSCGGGDINLQYSTTTDASGYASKPVPAPYWTVTGPQAADYQGGLFTYLSLRCGQPPAPGTTFTATLKTKKLVGGNYVQVAQVAVPIYVPFRRPDLIITDIVTSTVGVGGDQLRVGVVISNTEEVDAIGTFDVDIYVNPSHEPVLKGLPGLGTAGSGDTAPKQWKIDGLPKLSSTTIWYVLTLPSTGRFSIWAQVDTSDLIDERNNDNNIFGPKKLEYPCSDRSDYFTGPVGSYRNAYDPKWQFATLGTASGSGTAYLLTGQTLIIEGTGSTPFADNDGRYYFMHQGPTADDFDMHVQVLAVPNKAWAKSALMIRESVDPIGRYVAFGISKNSSNTGYVYMFWEKLGTGRAVGRDSCTSPVPSDYFTGANPSGVWLRAVKQGVQITYYLSTDGENWITDEGCMKITLPGAGFSAYYPGIAMLPY